MLNCIRELQVLKYVTPDTLPFILDFYNSNVKFIAQKY